MNMKRNTMVVIPAYEPTETLLSLASEITAAGYRLLVVDDGSSMACCGIWKKLNGPGIKILHHERNQGKGAALKTAFNYIKSHPYLEVQCVTTMDADGQHLVRDMEQVVFGAYQSPGTLVLGVREFSREVPFKSRMGNRITRTVFALTSGVRVRDTQTGLRAFTADLLERMTGISGTRYEYEMQMLTVCGRERIPIREVPIETIYIDPENSTSHFRPVMDSIRIYGDILRFAASSFVSFLADYTLFLAFLFLTGGMPYSLLVSNAGARVFSGGLNYFLNAKAVFRDEQPVRKTLPGYVALAAGILAGNTLLLSFLVQVVGISPVVAKILTEAILFVISYLVQSLVVFRKAKNTCPDSVNATGRPDMKKNIREILPDFR